MSREIKFRMWRDDKMHQLQSMESYHDSNFCFQKSEPHGKLMQYSGINDKDGKEIYEGDILFRKTTGTKGKVIFSEGKFIIKWDPIAGYVMFDSEINSAYDDEIIGNIYQNTELLTNNS